MLLNHGIMLYILFLRLTLMIEKYYFTERNNTDINMYRCGIEKCTPNHSWGPAVRDHYIIHYVLSGKGKLIIGNKEFTLYKGDGFLIPPMSMAHYQASANEPWSYIWAGFHGLKASFYMNEAGLNIENSVFNYYKDDLLEKCLIDMIKIAESKNNISRQLNLVGQFYIFLSLLIDSQNNLTSQSNNGNSELYVKEAVYFISTNYANSITVSDIASHVGINRSYLYMLFIKHLSVSPQQFLIRFKINKSIELMKNKKLTISEISRSVGYDDPLLFSRIFKKERSISPREYRIKQVSH